MAVCLAHGVVVSMADHWAISRAAAMDDEKVENLVWIWAE